MGEYRPAGHPSRTPGAGRAARPVLAALGALALSACVTVPRDAGFQDVSSSLASRTGKRIVWNRDSEDDRAVESAVLELLRQELTVDAAVQVALLNNRTLQATYEELGVAQADLVQAGLLRNPTFLLEVRFPARPRLPIESHILQSFVELFYIPLRKRVAGAEFEAAKARVAHATLATAADVAAAFYRLQGAEELLELRRTVVRATEASSDAATRLRAAGNITDLDLSAERALHAQAKLDLALAQTEVLDLREDLDVLLGLWGPETAFSVAARLPELPPADPDPAGFEARAVVQRFDLAAARSEIASLAQSLGLASWQRLVPTFDAGVHYEREPEGTGTLGPSAEISIPLFDQGQAARFAAGARLRQAQQRYAALAVEIRSQVRRAFGHMAAARARTELLSGVVLPLRRRVVSENQLRYNAMLTGVFQLLQSKQAEIDAGRERVEALRDYWIAKTDLERALGEPIEGPASGQGEARP